MCGTNIPDQAVHNVQGRAANRLEQALQLIQPLEILCLVS
jgi:hypothetical protein